MTHEPMRLTVYDFDTSIAQLTLGSAGIRFIYAVDGTVRVLSANGDADLQVDEGYLFDCSARLQGTGWLFDLTERGAPLLGGEAIAPVLSHIVEPDFEGPWLFRADRVSSDSGAQTPLHGHRGPGIRRLAKGRILATIGDNLERIEAGQAWFETGNDWVIGENISKGENVFVRVMLLPSELKGGLSSFVPATVEESTRPRSVKYRIFGELIV